MKFLVKFALIFLLLYYGTLAVIGLSTPDNHYSPFVARYLDYVSPLRASLLHAAGKLMEWMGYNMVMPNPFVLRIVHANSVQMVYSCIGYGIMCFWAAFVLADDGRLWYRFGWLLGGLLALWCINTLRICILLLANYHHWKPLLPFDHHTNFNIVAYALILLMIWVYTRKAKKAGTKLKSPGSDNSSFIMQHG